MKNRIITLCYVLIAVLLNLFSGSAQTDSSKVQFNGQLVGWTTVQFGRPLVVQPGGRFVPTLTGKFPKNDSTAFDFETSASINGNSTFERWINAGNSGEIKPYRVWGRYATSKFELRAGLQKINFGQAKLFRPLMWFDGMDIRDPLQLTNGVYGVLGKYFFPDNAALWAWVLIGNDSRKGWEFFGTEKWKPELGGRIELPLPKGEIAVSTHYRRVHALNLVSSMWGDYRLLSENRLGLDGKWDLGIGVWFESSTTITQKNEINVPRFQDMWNVGADYTFPLGSGLGLTVEYLRFHAGDAFFVKGNTVNLAGAMLTYPLSITDNVSAMLFYLPGKNQLFNYVSWSRMLDKWSFYLSGFMNPADAQLLSIQAASRNLFAGKGLQVMVGYNF